MTPNVEFYFIEVDVVLLDIYFYNNILYSSGNGFTLMVCFVCFRSVSGMVYPYVLLASIIIGNCVVC